MSLCFSWKWVSPYYLLMIITVLCSNYRGIYPVISVVISFVFQFFVINNPSTFFFIPITFRLYFHFFLVKCPSKLLLNHVKYYFRIKSKAPAPMACDIHGFATNMQELAYGGRAVMLGWSEKDGTGTIMIEQTISDDMMKYLEQMCDSLRKRLWMSNNLRWVCLKIVYP